MILWSKFLPQPIRRFMSNLSSRNPRWNTDHTRKRLLGRNKVGKTRLDLFYCAKFVLYFIL